MSSPTVVLLHGFAGFSAMNRPLTRMLQRSGYRAFELGYNSWGLGLNDICKSLSPRLGRISETCGPGELHLVCHSMGGLVAQALINLKRPQSLGHVVMLGTPNGGSEIADMLDRQALLRPILGKAGPALVTSRSTDIDTLLGSVDYSLGIIAGSKPVTRFGLSRLVPMPSDGKVSVESTRHPAAADHIVLPLPHMLLPYHPTAHRQITHFLDKGRFNHGEPD